MDTANFKGNYPDTCSLEACHSVEDDAARLPAQVWATVLPKSKLEADTRHFFEKEIAKVGPATHVRLNIFPDGGVSRLRVYGVPSREGRIAEGLRRLNALPPESAEASFVGCCGSPRWARELAGQRPFATAESVYAAAEKIAATLAREDWLEAFRSHPPIGEKKAEGQQSAQAQNWSSQEQAGAGAADAATCQGLAEANRAYRERFGNVYIVCATGKSAAEMLALCKQRMANDPETEFRIAAGEQRKIARLRLEKLLTL